MKTLTARLVAYYSLVVTITVAAAMALGFCILKRQVVSGSDFLLDKEFVEIRAKLHQVTTPYHAESIREAVYHHALIDSALFYFQIHNEAGHILFRSPNLGVAELPDLTLSKPMTKTSVQLPGLGLVRVSEYYSGDLHIQLGTSLSYLERLSGQFYLGLAVMLPAVLVLSIVAGFALSQITLRPLRLIQETARRINADNLSERIPLPRGQDELARLTELLNAMFDRLEGSFAQIKQITADTSHELRTPLSIIRLRADKALEHPELPPSVREELQDLLDEVHRLNRILDQLMILAKAESQTLPLSKRRLLTSEFIFQFQEDAATLAEHEGRRFEILSNERITASFDEAWIRQVLFNLLSNAIKHSPANSTIRLESRLQGSCWQTTMTDEGPGVPSEQLHAIFERFVQIKSVGRSADGYGLGLAVCKSIIELHRGRISSRNLPSGQGFAVTFEIPCGSS